MPANETSSGRISREAVAHVAKLALLELRDDELDIYTAQLAAVLDHARDVEVLDLADVAPTYHPLPLKNVFRADERSGHVDRDEVLAMAPAVESGRFRVPAILSEEA